MNAIGQVLIPLVYLLLVVIYALSAIGLTVFLFDFILFGGRLMPRIQQWCLRKVGLER